MSGTNYSETLTPYRLNLKNEQFIKIKQRNINFELLIKKIIFLLKIILLLTKLLKLFIIKKINYFSHKFLL